MKKIILVILCVAMLISVLGTSCASEANPRNERLDAAFESGKLRLAETDSSFLKPDVSDFEVSEALWEFVGEEYREKWDSEIRSLIESGNLTLFSRSPAGHSGIASANGYPLFSFYQGKYHVILPTNTKGVEDAYANLEKYYDPRRSEGIRQLVGKEGIAYSPDGRYAAIFNCSSVISRFIHLDPVLMDLSTGELFLTATYPKDWKEKESGSVTAAVFSSDGKYFYYLLKGNFENGRARLYRYHLDSGETELCLETDETVCYPRLSELSDGSLLMLDDKIMDTDRQSFFVASPKGDTWILDEHPLALEISSIYSNRILYAPGSGYACLLEGRNADYATAFQVIAPERGFEGMDRILVISKDSGQVEVLSPEEYKNVVDTELRGDTKNILSALPTFPYQLIHNAVFSPDGNYLLVFTMSPSTEGSLVKNLILVRISDLATQSIEGFDAEEINMRAYKMEYPMEIEWNTDELMIGTSDGVRTYSFVYDNP